MKLYPEATKRYVDQSGNCRTRASRRTVTTQLGLLQASQPNLELDQFRTEHITTWCLSTIRVAPSPGTIKARASVAKAFFSWCVWQKMLEHSPAEDLRYTVRPGHQKVRQSRWLTEAELTELLRALPSTPHGQRDKLIVMFGSMMGLRRYEIAGLRWEQLSSDMSRLTFIGKGQKLAQLGVPRQLQAELKAWRRQAPVGVQTVLPSFKGPFGGAQWGDPLGVGGVEDAVTLAGKNVGIHLLPHDLRRTFAGILEKKGTPVKDISRLMRHSNVGTTDTYLEDNPERAVALADTFELAL